MNVNFYFQIILKKIVSKDAACETNSEMNFTISKGKVDAIQENNYLKRLI